MEAAHNIGILFRGFTGLTLVPCRSISYLVPGHTFNTVLWKTPMCRIKDAVQLSENKKEAPEKRMLLSMAPQVGLEPTTLRLTVACSTD